jgi:hypothetical protein
VGDRERWFEPVVVRPTRVALVAVDTRVGLDRVRAALVPLEASTLFVDASDGALDALVGSFRDLVHDGCDPEQLVMLGVNGQATAPLAATLLLRLAGLVPPAAIAAATPTAHVALRPAATTSEALVRHLVALIPTADRDRGVTSALERMAGEVGQLLASENS